MSKKKLFLMCGPAGSGKSTWAARRVSEKAMWVSRDNIRFILVKEDEDYFSREDEVFEIFIQSIKNALDANRVEEVYVDATHLTEKARNKVLDLLDLTNCDIIPVIVKPDLKTTLEQNDQREGRAFVPRSVIKRMDTQFERPTFNEKHRYAEIWQVIKDGIMVIPNNGGNK